MDHRPELSGDTATIRARQQGVFSWRYSLRAGGELLTELSASWIRERARFEVEGQTYHVARVGLLRGGFQLTGPKGLVATAVKPSFLRRTFQVEWGERQLTLRALSPVSLDFGLFEGTERLGTIRSHVLLREAILELPLELPLELRVFLLSLVVFLWKRGVNSG